MPKVSPDPQLLDALNALVAQAEGNESSVARQLGTTRLRVNRIRKQKGAATATVRDEMWRKLEAVAGVERSNKVTQSIKSDTDAIQVLRDVPGVALQVLRYIAEAIERDRAPKSSGRHGR